MTIEQVGVIPAFRIRYQGEEVTVDHRTFTLGERRRSRRALVELTEGEARRAGDDREAFADLVDHALEEVSQVPRQHRGDATGRPFGPEIGGSAPVRPP